MVVNTLLSLMAYNYPSDKLNVYLSDDGGSELMFYALLEASRFSKHWLPFCKHFNVEPRSPAAYFSTPPPPLPNPNHYLSIKVRANPVFSAFILPLGKAFALLSPQFHFSFGQMIALFIYILP